MGLYRQTDRQTDRQTYRQTQKMRDIWIIRQTLKMRDLWIIRQTDRKKYIYSETSISGLRYPDLLDIQTKICPYIEYRGCVINKENVPIFDIRSGYRIYVKIGCVIIKKIFRHATYFYIYSISGLDRLFDNRTCPVIKILLYFHFICTIVFLTWPSKVKTIILYNKIACIR
jgi:hypothetical protein